MLLPPIWYGSYNTNQPSPETQGGRIFTIKQGENGNAATVTNKWISYDSVKSAEKGETTETIGDSPFAGQIIDLEAGKLPTARIKGFVRFPSIAMPKHPPFFLSQTERASEIPPLLPYSKRQSDLFRRHRKNRQQQHRYFS